jgi:hypothetical protein
MGDGCASFAGVWADCALFLYRLTLFVARSKFTWSN